MKFTNAPRLNNFDVPIGCHADVGLPILFCDLMAVNASYLLDWRWISGSRSVRRFFDLDGGEFLIDQVMVLIVDQNTNT